MKRKMIFLVLLILSINVFAQKKSATEKAKEKTDEMTKTLTLTSEQNKKIYEVNTRAYIAIANYEAKDLSKKLKKKQKNVVKDLRDAEYKKILTSSQWTKWKDIKKKEKEEEEKLDNLKPKKDKK